MSAARRGRGAPAQPRTQSGRGKRGASRGRAEAEPKGPSPRGKRDTTPRHARKARAEREGRRGDTAQPAPKPRKDAGRTGRPRPQQDGAQRRERAAHGAARDRPAHGAPGTPAPLPSFDAPAARRVLPAEPQRGQWLFATREGAEQDLIDELRLAGLIDPAACRLAPGLVLAPPLAGTRVQPSALTFARQGFPIGHLVQSDGALLDALTSQLSDALEDASDYALQVWVPDSSAANPLAGRAAELHRALGDKLASALPASLRLDDASLRRQGTAHFAQVCLLDADRALCGVLASDAAPSLAPGGRTRVRVSGDLPSRAARKLVEALAWLGMQPGEGEQCVDLGAAPGGWCYVLTEKRAQVIAVDPAKLRPDIQARRGVRHVQDSAFTFAPDEPVDWLFCDMAWRPLEVAALLARWGRRRWTRMLVANIKLPMKRKAELLARIRYVLEHEGGYQDLRMKQLYHDRDEITLTARVV